MDQVMKSFGRNEAIEAKIDGQPAILSQKFIENDFLLSTVFLSLSFIGKLEQFF